MNELPTWPETLPRYQRTVYGSMVKTGESHLDALAHIEHWVKLADVRASWQAQEAWTCKARKSSADPPQDCSWPTCGCDPYADKVIAALQEEGALRLTQGKEEKQY